MHKSFNFEDKKFVVYGLGLTGKSVIKFLKKNKANNIYVWDDHLNNSIIQKKKFKEKLLTADHLILSPGININKSEFKNLIIKNREKILSDLDLFFLKYNVNRSIVITGTNGKSTTCSIIHHVFNKNNIKAKLAGNIGAPILEMKFKKQVIYIIEASSFQLEYSKFVKPYCAAILNITDDHLDWHGTKNKYIKSKFKIFKNQTKEDIALINDLNLKKIYFKKKYLAKLRFIKKKPLIANYINNEYLKLDVNKDNLIFAYNVSKIFKIKKNNFFKSLISFNGLSHRQEKFLKFKKYTFINDSKATSFEATQSALNSNKKIIWILGGKPKKNDKFFLKKYKNKILKAYIIGRNSKHFIKQLKNYVKFEVIKDLKNVIKRIFQSYNKNIETTVLLSPASASYDQFKNFEDRGEKFKKYVRLYAKKFL